MKFVLFNILSLCNQLVASISLSMIPITGTPPEKVYGVSSTYDEARNRIIVFGGFRLDTKEYNSNLYFFSFDSLKWDLILPESDLMPPGLAFARITIYSDNLYVFFGEKYEGVSSDIFCFNLITYVWSVAIFQGDIFQGRSNYAFTTFSYLDIHFAAIFGGFSNTGIYNDLFLQVLFRINLENMTSTQMEQKGDIPEPRIGASLNYLDEIIYLYGQTQNASSLQNNLVNMYDLKTQEWKLINNEYFPDPRIDHQSLVHENQIFIIYGYDINTLIPVYDIWKFDIASFNWTYLKTDTENYVTLIQGAVIGSVQYLICGFTLSGNKNSIKSLDVSSSDLKIVTVSADWEFPPRRKYYCSVRVFDDIIIFGGVDNNGNHLNDMWTFKITESQWSTVDMTGNIPNARKNMACVNFGSIGIVVIAGSDSTQLYNDIYYFDIGSSYWNTVTLGMDNFYPRHRACIAMYGDTVIITGGSNYQKNFDDIWYYTYSVGVFQIMNTNDPLKFSLNSHNCKLTTDSGKSIMHIIGGRSFINEPNYNYYQVEILDHDGGYESSTKLVLSSSSISTSENSVMLIDDLAFILPGTKWDRFVWPTANIFNIKTYEISSIEFDEDLALFGYSAVHYRNSFYILGGGKSAGGIKLGTIVSDRLYKITSNSSDIISIGCSDGTYGPDCTPCQAGTYYSGGKCIDCPAGTYSLKIAGTEIFSCLPCAYGTYNSKTGLAYCRICPSNKLCPLGCSEPEDTYAMPTLSDYQPSLYEKKTSAVNNMINIIWYSFSGLTLVIVLISVFVKKIWEKLEKFDIMSMKHPTELNQPKINKKTRIGGLFSLVFYFIALVIACGSLLTYFLDNILEIKSMMPTVLLESEIKADSFDAIIRFYRYGGNCVISSDCVSQNTFSETDISFSSKSVSCEKDMSDCVVNIKYSIVKMGSNPEINIKMQESSSYASGIGVNVSSTSSIPNSLSGVFIPLEPDSVDKIFKGLDPSAVSIKLIPSVKFIQLFSSDSSEWKSGTGYHLTSNNDIQLGSMVTQQTQLRCRINVQRYVYLDIKFTMSDTVLITQRLLNNSFFIFIGGMLGSIFGILGIIGGMMAFSESIVENVENKVNLKKKLNNIFGVRKKYKLYLTQKNTIDAISDLKEDYTARTFPY